MVNSTTSAPLRCNQPGYSPIDPNLANLFPDSFFSAAQTFRQANHLPPMPQPLHLPELAPAFVHWLQQHCAQQPLPPPPNELAWEALVFDHIYCLRTFSEQNLPLAIPSSQPTLWRYYLTLLSQGDARIYPDSAAAKRYHQRLLDIVYADENWFTHTQAQLKQNGQELLPSLSEHLPSSKITTQGPLLLHYAICWQQQPALRKLSTLAHLATTPMVLTNLDTQQIGHLYPLYTACKSKQPQTIATLLLQGARFYKGKRYPCYQAHFFDKGPYRSPYRMKLPLQAALLGGHPETIATMLGAYRLFGIQPTERDLPFGSHCWWRYQCYRLTTSGQKSQQQHPIATMDKTQQLLCQQRQYAQLQQDCTRIQHKLHNVLTAWRDHILVRFHHIILLTALSALCHVYLAYTLFMPLMLTLWTFGFWLPLLVACLAIHRLMPLLAYGYSPLRNMIATVARCLGAQLLPLTNCLEQVWQQHGISWLHSSCRPLVPLALIVLPTLCRWLGMPKLAIHLLTKYCQLRWYQCCLRIQIHRSQQRARPAVP